MRKIIILIALFLPVLCFSQTSDLGNWIIYFGNKKINPKWNWHHEVQYRNYNAVGDLEQLLLRTGIGYDIAENTNLLLGYGFILSENYITGTEDKVSVNEHRVYQQIISRHSIGSRVKVQHRYRFEQRWVEDTDIRLRFRYFLSLNIPINNKEFVDDTWYASMYNEIFLNHQQVIFDRNRLYGGIGYRLNKTAKFEIGYMNQFLNNRNSDQINLITFLNF